MSSTGNSTLEHMARMADMLASQSLAAFVKRAWHVIEPGRALIWGWMHDAICEHFEALLSGEITKLIINQPPGSTKTTVGSICLPCYAWISQPELRFMSASYGIDVVRKSSIKRRQILKSSWFRSAFLNSARSWDLDNRDAQLEIGNTRGGEMLSTTVGGQATGRHFDIIGVDDPLKAEDIYTVKLEQHVRWFFETLESRVTDVRTARFFVIQQRLHQKDLSGILAEDSDWVHLRLPAEFDPGKRCSTSIGWTDPRTEPGELLLPERFPREYLEKRKGPFGLGPIAYSGQYNQDPVSGEGNIIERGWWRFWSVGEKYEKRLKAGEDVEKLPDQFDRTLSSWDMSFKAGIDADFVVGQIWGQKEGMFYLLDQFRSRLGFTATVAAVKRMKQKHPNVPRWLVELKANGEAVVDTLKKQIPGFCGVNPTESKESRVASVSEAIRSGNVVIPHPKDEPWVANFIEESIAFPLGANDDQIDAAAQALRDMMQMVPVKFEMPKFRSRERQNPDVHPALATLQRYHQNKDRFRKRWERKARKIAKSHLVDLASARKDPYSDY